MTRIAVELVPRNEQTLLEELQVIHTHYPTVNVINIPDLLRFDLRSWEGCCIAKRFFTSAIPHLRAIDFNLNEPLPVVPYLRAAQITEVLVLQGDPPQGMERKVYPSTSIELIRKLKEEMPELRVYGAIDQYRTSMRQELNYIKRKIAAGADGFFTQPFFDLRFMEMYMDALQGQEVFWGVSPVLGEKSVNYWETKNNVVFPARFQPTLEWNIGFAREALALAGSAASPIYFMPIRMDMQTYLGGVLKD
ncbi:methylenetetrahydrofolate reductase [Heliophilum fasciatum]|uniref:Methylenetetrahydrofolate reductase n=1 Tax=Heliophilum fasciatum TaxID=35700 RepID=A0A4R2RZ89_9FIRM|nr:methylenetetrahydrofolate reductase [Heliophilum fasciatum]MCW2276721.1 methylenetetrahydrofolate reductase (NADPH) [Heliophilum fasciatum]TCP68898.1 methylenetetrahydrofolate reductase (NADPH) [Heliophilum fasciatum]